MVRRRVWVAKDSPRTTAGENSWVTGSKKLNFKWMKAESQKLVKQPPHHHMLFWRVSRKIIAHPKTNSNAYSVITRLELQMGLASMVRWNKKNTFLTTNTQDGFGEHRDKKYPMCTMKYTAVYWMLWAYIFCWGPGHLV